ncbi:PASTA domain-containing protein [Chlorobium sp. N1]|uniref:PASTA domain-containing protein n=1 Tax=Chlorobium sp. N1 TaxID=2491138 RepID=UPI00103E165D|nr:PASTA domain-containing protein [Chlorobium sp. N1]TCD48416.1 PASTA domain-containing protein [Chlorobium sp. N1]
MMKKAGLIFLIVFLLAGLFDRVIMPWYVSSGSAVTVPDVTGLQYDEAASKLSWQGFDPKKRYHVKYVTGVDSTVVLSQSPAAGQRVKKGRDVYLVVNRREKPSYPMADLVGRIESDARQTMARMDIIIDEVQTSTVSSREEDGRVLSQSVPEGVMVKPGSTVSLIVGRFEESDAGMEKLIVPDVLGMSLSQAEKVIGDAGLRRGSVTKEYSAILVPNTVISQRPAVSAYVSPGQKVDLTVVTAE